MKFVKIKIPKITDHDTYFKSNDLSFILNMGSGERAGAYHSGHLDKKKDTLEIPELYYAVYKYIISVSLFNHEAHIFCHSTNNKNELEIIDKLLKKDVSTNYSFSKKLINSSSSCWLLIVLILILYLSFTINVGTPVNAPSSEYLFCLSCMARSAAMIGKLAM